MLERCRLPELNAVAEVGCGSGEMLHEVMALAGPALAVGVDLDRELLERASGFDARLGSGDDLPVGDEAFDLVYYSRGFHVAEDRQRGVAELRRVLKPGGWAAIWTPEGEPPEPWMRLLADGGFPWVAEQQLPARGSEISWCLIWTRK